MKKMKELVRYKELLKNLILKNLKIRYQGSFFGFAWSMLDPLLMTLTFIFVFKVVLNTGIPDYAAYLLCGIFPWSFMASSLNNSAFSITSNGNLINKVYFPTELLPLASVLSNAVHFVISILILLPILLLLKIHLSLLLLFLPLIILVQSIFIIGLALLIACGNVFFRDTPFILAAVLQAWFFLTPIFYDIGRFSGVASPGILRSIPIINPMAAFLLFYRDILMYDKIPPIPLFIVTLATSLIVLAVCYVIFNVFKDRFAEEA